MDIYTGQRRLGMESRYLGFLWQVISRLVWETATDTTTGLAAQMAYLLLFALAPGSLFLWHLLGLFGTDPTKLHRMFLLLKSFMPRTRKCRTFSILRWQMWWSQARAACSRMQASFSEFILGLSSSRRPHAP